VSLSDRDRKIVLILIPLLVLGAYWFMLLAPKREEASNAQQQLSQARTERDQAVALANSLEAAKVKFATDYAEILRLGKAIPSTVDMSSLLVQLDSAARGTGINFEKITVGKREAAAPPGEATGGTGGQAADGSTPAAGGSTPPAGSTPPGGSEAPGQPASAPGAAKSAATGAVNDANAQTAAGDQKAAQTSGEPGAAGSPAGGSTTSGVAGLDRVPLTFVFEGSYFDLADFMHRLKRFVRVTNSRVLVRGRLMTVDGVKLTPSAGSQITADITASVYLTPKQQGTTAGATPTGPAPNQGTPAATPGQQPQPATTPPTAAATP
jgi:Tfp pilus assembly protein PilO